MASAFTRQELYELVWADPVKTVASRLGVSDVAVGKACRKAAVPLPERGYWAKKNAGNDHPRPELPPRFPGASDEITFGGTQGGGWSIDLEDELPPPPHFSENIDSLRARISSLVGSVPCKSLASITHSLIAKLLEQDQERLDKGYGWDQPQFVAPLQKRRLRIINSIFIASQRLGCRPTMAMSKYAESNRDVTIGVGESNVHFSLLPIDERGCAANASKMDAKRLRLCVRSNSYRNEERCRAAWEDTEQVHLEDVLSEIVTEILVAGEEQYREWRIRQHEWMVQRKAELQEEERQRILEQERRAREALEAEERARVERLLSEAMALQKADTIRNYVAEVIERASLMETPQSGVKRWAAWALAQADRIDPVKNLLFLELMESAKER